jgi:hypothetical protein
MGEHVIVRLMGSTAGALAALLAFSTAATAAPAAPAEQRSSAAGPRINDVLAFDAPIGGKGGFQNTFVSCANYRVEPRAVMEVRNPATGWKRTFRWTGALPGLFFPRVATGTYEARTTVRCAGVRRVRKEKFAIREKTLEGTMSRAEFDAIVRGMSRADVATIVGNSGRDPFTYGGSTQVTYDNMPFWAWSTISYRNDRVVEKAWQVAHD